MKSLDRMPRGITGSWIGGRFVAPSRPSRYAETPSSRPSIAALAAVEVQIRLSHGSIGAVMISASMSMTFADAVV